MATSLKLYLLFTSTDFLPLFQCSLAVLDSAVTHGPYYSKTFLMRDGKNTLPCVFYEIVSICLSILWKAYANKTYICTL